MTWVEFAKYVFDFTFNSFTHWLGVVLLLGAFRLVTVHNWGK